MANPVYCVIRVDRDDVSRLLVQPIVTVEPRGCDTIALYKALIDAATFCLRGDEPPPETLIKIEVNAEVERARRGPRQMRLITVDFERLRWQNRIVLAVVAIFSLLMGIGVGARLS